MNERVRCSIPQRRFLNLRTCAHPTDLASHFPIVLPIGQCASYRQSKRSAMRAWSRYSDNGRRVDYRTIRLIARLFRCFIWMHSRPERPGRSQVASADGHSRERHIPDHDHGSCPRHRCRDLLAYCGSRRCDHSATLTDLPNETARLIFAAESTYSKGVSECVLRLPSPAGHRTR
jgi:hypothetical protein